MASTFHSAQLHPLPVSARQARHFLLDRRHRLALVATLLSIPVCTQVQQRTVRMCRNGSTCSLGTSLSQDNLVRTISASKRLRGLHILNALAQLLFRSRIVEALVIYMIHMQMQSPRHEYQCHRERLLLLQAEALGFGNLDRILELVMLRDIRDVCCFRYDTLSFVTIMMRRSARYAGYARAGSERTWMIIHNIGVQL